MGIDGSSHDVFQSNSGMPGVGRASGTIFVVLQQGVGTVLQQAQVALLGLHRVATLVIPAIGRAVVQ